jgi:hypothetical protein
VRTVEIKAGSDSIPSSRARRDEPAFSSTVGKIK